MERLLDGEGDIFVRLEILEDGSWRGYWEFDAYVDHRIIILRKHYINAVSWEYVE